MIRWPVWVAWALAALVVGTLLILTFFPSAS